MGCEMMAAGEVGSAMNSAENADFQIREVMYLD